MTESRIAECLLEMGQLDEAEEIAQRALQFFEAAQDQNRIKQVRATIQRITEAKGV